jgi:hypothetical protein
MENTAYWTRAPIHSGADEVPVLTNAAPAIMLRIRHTPESLAMRSMKLSALILLLLGASVLVAQDDDKLISGPRPGSFMPGAFEAMNINGPAKGRQRCLVCEFALNPAVLIFTKEPAEGKNGALMDLIKKLDEVTAEFEERNFSVGVIVLSPDARDSTNNAKEADAAKLIKEAVDREELSRRLKKRAEGLKKVIVAYYAEEGPKDYKLNPKAEATVLFYDRMKVIDNWTFAPGKLEAEDVESMVKKVRETLPIKKKAVEKGQKA